MTYFDTMLNKSRGALYGGSYVTRLAQKLGVFDALHDLTKRCHMIALDMDTFHSMHLVEKRGDVYVLIDGALPVSDEGPDAPIHAPTDLWVRVEVTQWCHEIMLCHLHSQMEWQQ